MSRDQTFIFIFSLCYVRSRDQTFINVGQTLTRPALLLYRVRNTHTGALDVFLT
jgi:hypothetical protein